MARTWRSRQWLAPSLIVVSLCAGCASKRTAPVAAPAAVAAPTTIALLPDPETHVTGRIRVSNEFGAVDVSAPRASLRATAGAAPGPLSTLSEEEVARLFGGAMAALPPAPKHYILQFAFESDTLTAASSELVPQILRAVKALPVPEVMIVGHTDTMGDQKSNVALGLKRATRVRDILLKAGLTLATVDVTSHGEGDLLIQTRDNSPEPRNRRVEITVR
jgi:outer membrane protein OmpA-like peptidoglycan-associated protein